MLTGIDKAVNSFYGREVNLLTSYMPTPKGGRGHRAPYETKLTRIPVPLQEQVTKLIERYQAYLDNDGDALNPPSLLDLGSGKAVNNLSIEDLQQQLVEARAEIEALQAKQVNIFELLKASREEFLCSLKLGRQAPEYKRSKNILDRFLEICKRTIQ